MAKKALVSFLIFICLFQGVVWTTQNKYYELGVYTDEYCLSIFPDYPPLVGQEITLRLRTFSPAQRATLYSDREEEIPMIYREGHFWGKFKIPQDYKEGSHFFTVWIKYSFTPPVKTPSIFSAWLKYFGYKEKPSSWWSKSSVWYKAVKKKLETEKLGETVLTPIITFEAEEIPPPVTGEAIEITVVSPEVPALLIKGSQTIAFSSRRLEGSKEGYAPGTTHAREETLRINISGKAADTEIEANLYKTSASGAAQVDEDQDKVSILLRRGNLEGYLGDFTADLTETEFAKLDKVLSGGRLKGDYEKWGFTLLSSSPKGGAKFVKMYGDGTQGPYALSSPANVVVDSERVYVDNVLQKRGDDYTIDHSARTITFKNKVIDQKSIIQVYFDYRETTYSHSTYGLRAFVKPLSNLKIGTTYLNDSDSTSGAETTYEQTGIAPSGHYLLGGDLSFVSELLTLDSELAYSQKELNLLSLGSSREVGRAGKLNLNSQLGPFGISARAKKVGAKFSPIADPNPKQDIFEYAGGLSFRPFSLFGAQGNYAYEKYTQSSVTYENLYKTIRTNLTPERFPSLEYNFSETDESNDPVTGSSIQRVITKNSAETIYQLGFLSTSLKGTTEKWLKRSPSEEATNYLKINGGLSSVGLEKISFAGNAEYEKREEPSGSKPSRKTYNLNLSATPSKQYFISSALQIIDDSSLGKSQVLDLSYQAEPVDIFKTEGKYTVTSVKEDFPSPGTAEAVSKQTGSFSFDVRPTRALRLRYLYKPNYTQVLRTNTLSYNNEQQQAEVNVIPIKEMLLGLIYKLGRTFNVDKTDYPNYSRKNDSTDSDSSLYTVKIAPFTFLSTEFNHLLENSSTLTLVSTVEPITYTKGQSKGKKFDVLVKTPLTEKFSIDSRYTYQKSDQGTGESVSNVSDTLSQTGSLKIIWNLTEIFALTGSGSYTQSINNLATANRETYTYSPGIGFIYRRGEILRIDGDFSFSKSFAGSETEKQNLSLKTKYSLSDYVNLTLQWEQEISRTPDYRLTDFTGNIEINL